MQTHYKMNTEHCFKKLQTGSISDAERTRYTMLKNMLGI